VPKGRIRLQIKTTTSQVPASQVQRHNLVQGRSVLPNPKQANNNQQRIVLVSGAQGQTGAQISTASNVTVSSPTKSGQSIMRLTVTNKSGPNTNGQPVRTGGVRLNRPININGQDSAAVKKLNESPSTRPVGTRLSSKPLERKLDN